MKGLYLVAVLLLILLVAIPTANAGDCRQAIVVQQQAYYAPSTYYPQQLALGIFVPAPSYTVGLSLYDPATADKFDALIKRLEALEQRLTAPPILPQKAAATQCAACHNGSKADAPRLDFGNLSADQKALVAEKILDGSMPPKGGIEKSKRRVVVAELIK